MAISLQRYSLTGRKRMTPDMPQGRDLSMRRSFFPPVTEEPQLPTLDTAEPVGIGLNAPAPARPRTTLSAEGSGYPRSAIGTIPQEEVDRLEPITMADVKANLGKGLQYGIPMALSKLNPMSMVPMAAIDLTIAGGKKLWNYAAPKVRGALGMGGEGARASEGPPAIESVAGWDAPHFGSELVGEDRGKVSDVETPTMGTPLGMGTAFGPSEPAPQPQPDKGWFDDDDNEGGGYGQSDNAPSGMADWT